MCTVFFLAITGQGYTYAELKDTADFLKRELLLVKDVASVKTWGEQQEIVELELARARMAELGISITSVIATLNRQNQISDAGRVKVDNDHLRITPTGAFKSIEALGDLLVQSDAAGNLIYLKDVVAIHHSYQDPPPWIMRHNGRPAIGLGISTVDGGNVVEMGEAVRRRIVGLTADIPVGMQLEDIAYQSDLVAASVKSFLINLVEAVVIVIIVLCVTMGLSSGLLMGAVLLLTIFGTLIGMQLLSIDFQMISLGALILALGMLVDNAIVVTEGILVRVQQGMNRKKAAVETVSQTAWPLLGATIVAVLAFAAIGTSQDTTGEFLKSLFLVMAISLFLSWVLAITLTPLFCVQFFPKSKKNRQKDPYAGKFYQWYRKFLDHCLCHRALSLMLLGGMLVAAMFGFSHVENNFFPDDSRNQFMLNYWRPEGTHIQNVSEDLERLEQYLGKLDDVATTTTFIGQGALRFVLTYDPEMPNSSYGMILVTVHDHKRIDPLFNFLRADLAEQFPDSRIELKKFRRGPGEDAQIQARFSGSDITVLRQLSQDTEAIIAADPVAVDIRNDWRQPVQTIRPRVIEAVARRMGITRPEISDALAMNFSGKTIGMFRQGDTLLPIQIRAPQKERETVERINDIVVFSPINGKAVPLRQIVNDMHTAWENPMIRRLNRRRTLTVSCNPIYGTPDTLLARLQPKIEAIALPPGYILEWGGDYENSMDAKKRIISNGAGFFSGHDLHCCSALQWHQADHYYFFMSAAGKYRNHRRIAPHGSTLRVHVYSRIPGAIWNDHQKRSGTH